MASPKRNANRPKFDRKPIDLDDLTNASAFGGIRDVIESHFGKPETSGGAEPADPDALATDGSEAPPVFETDPDRLEYLWNPKESPISVRLGAELIGRLEKESLDIFRAITNRGSEIGGLLLGRVVPGRPSIVIVEDFEPVACGYTLGPTFLLSGDEQQRMREAMSQRKPGDDIQVVGFFRSNTRPVLSMAEEDSVLLDRLFPEDHHIFLLAKPFSRKPCQGAIFVREDRKFQGEASHLEFPFSKAELEKLGQLEPAIRVASGGASRVTPIRPPAPPSAPEPEKPAAMAPPVQSQPAPPRPVAPVVPEPARPAAMAPPVRSQPAPAAPVPVEEKAETIVQTKIEPKLESNVPPRPVTQDQPKVQPSVAAPARPVWRFKPAVQPPVPSPAPAQPVPPADSAKALRIQPAIKPPVPLAPPARPVPPPAESARAPQPPQVQPVAKPPVPLAPPARPVPPPAESAKAPQPPQVLPAAKPPVQPVAAARPMRPVPPPAESAKTAEPKVPPPAKPPVQPVAAAQPARPAAPAAEPAKATEQKKSRAESVPEPAPPGEKAVPEFRFGAEDASSPRSRVPLVVGAFVVAIVALSLFFLLRPSQPIGPPAPRVPAASAAPQSPALVLLVEASDSALMVRWDSSNPAIVAASSGSLSFVDGSVKSSVPLSSAELKQGAYKYKPRSNDLAIRLEVSGAPGAPNVFGATRILGAQRMLAPAAH